MKALALVAKATTALTTTLALTLSAQAVLAEDIQGAAAPVDSFQHVGPDLEKLQADLINKKLDRKIAQQTSKLNDQLEQQIASRMSFAFDLE